MSKPCWSVFCLQLWPIILNKSCYTAWSCSHACLLMFPRNIPLYYRCQQSNLQAKPEEWTDFLSHDDAEISGIIFTRCRSPLASNISSLQVSFYNPPLLFPLSWGYFSICRAPHSSFLAICQPKLLDDSLISIKIVRVAIACFKFWTSNPLSNLFLPFW